MALGPTVKLNALSTCKSSPSFTFSGRFPGKTPKEAAPAPGHYGIPSRSEIAPRVLTSNFGATTSKRSKTNWDNTCPGPGQYTGKDPNQTTPHWMFGSEARIPKKKVELGPEPGHYPKKSTLSDRPISFGERFESKKGPSTDPAPGQYGIPPDDSIRKAAETAASFRFTEDRAKTNFTRSTNISPGPVHYTAMKELGGNIATRTSPSFSFTSRRKPPRPDNGSHPGPKIAFVTTFGTTR